MAVLKREARLFKRASDVRVAFRRHDGQTGNDTILSMIRSRCFHPLKVTSVQLQFAVTFDKDLLGPVHQNIVDGLSSFSSVSAPQGRSPLHRVRSSA